MGLFFLTWVQHEAEAERPFPERSYTHKLGNIWFYHEAFTCQATRYKCTINTKIATFLHCSHFRWKSTKTFHRYCAVCWRTTCISISRACYVDCAIFYTVARPRHHEAITVSSVIRASVHDRSHVQNKPLARRLSKDIARCVPAFNTHHISFVKVMFCDHKSAIILCKTFYYCIPSGWPTNSQHQSSCHNSFKNTRAKGVCGKSNLKPIYTARSVATH